MELDSNLKNVNCFNRSINHVNDGNFVVQNDMAEHSIENEINKDKPINNDDNNYGGDGDDADDYYFEDDDGDDDGDEDDDDNVDDLPVLRSEDVESDNQEILEQEFLFSEIPEQEDYQDLIFPELTFEIEKKEILDEYTSDDFKIEKLNEVQFFVECIYNNVTRIHNKTYNSDLILYLWSKPIEFLNEILKKIGYGITGCDKENALTLIYWSLYFGLDIKVDLKLRNFMVLHPNEDIIKLYQHQTNKKWEFTRDRATIFYILFNKCVLPIRIDYTVTERYIQILNENPDVFYKLFKYVYNGRHEFLSPVRYLASLKKSELEKYIYFTDAQLFELMQTIEYIPIETINYKDYRFYKISTADNFVTSLYQRIIHNQKILVRKFLHNLSFYKNVIFKDCTNETLSQLTDLQLLNQYKPDLNYSNREQLINSIKKGLIESHVRINHPYNSINKNYNVLTLEARIITDEDPLISIGTLLNYQSYNYLELVGSFESGSFNKPDSLKEQFNYSDIITLQKELEKHEKLPDGKLCSVIKNGLQFLDNIELRIKKLKEIYSSCSFNGTDNIKQTLVKFLFLGFYAKYWKGPGYQYPHMWIDRKDLKNNVSLNHNLDQSSSKSVEENYATYIEREYNVNKLFNELNNANPKILDWIKLIPRIDYDWQTSKYRYGTESFYSIFDQTFNGKFCLSHFSNICLQTIYAIFILVLQMKEDDINILIKNLYPEHKYSFNSMENQNSTHVDYSINFKFL